MQLWSDETFCNYTKFVKKKNVFTLVQIIVKEIKNE